ncbi:MAG: alpha/beta fold hydrolase [Candidatus Hodarchaeales archaeon]|jgi:pimeloyl-ACP methyl ester carboxylesterase
MSKISVKTTSTPYGSLEYYRAVNPNQDSQFLWIHGLGGNKTWFSQQYEPYSLSEYSWIVPDLLGYGQSAKPADPQAYTMAAQAQALLQLLKEEEVHSLSIFGHSMGGPIAISLLEQLMEQKDSHSIELTGLFYLEGNLDKNDAFYSSQIAQYSYSDYERDFDKLLAPSSKFVDFYNEARNAGPMPIWASSRDVAALSESNTLFPRLQRLIQTLNLPVYFIFGEKNRGRFSSEDLVRKAQLPLIFIPDVGHDLQLESPATFWPKIKELLEIFNE